MGDWRNFVVDAGKTLRTLMYTETTLSACDRRPTNRRSPTFSSCLKRLQIDRADNRQISSVKLCASVFDSSLWAPPAIDRRHRRRCMAGLSNSNQFPIPSEGTPATPMTTRPYLSVSVSQPPWWRSFCISLYVFLCLCASFASSFRGQSDRIGPGRLRDGPSLARSLLARCFTSK